MSTFPAESEAAIVNTMTLRHREILSWWPHSRYGSDYHVDRRHDIGQPTPPATWHLPHATCHMPPAARHPQNYARHMPPASHLAVPGACNSASLWIEHAGAYMEAYSQVRLRVSSHLRVYLRATRRCTWVRTRRCSWECLESLLGSIQSSRLAVCHRVQLGVYLRACSGV